MPPTCGILELLLGERRFGKCQREIIRNLNYIKDKKVRLQLNVYQKNARAISFYQREGFIIQCEDLDEATGEKEYTMLWKQK